MLFKGTHCSDLLGWSFFVLCPGPYVIHYHHVRAVKWNIMLNLNCFKTTKLK